MSKKIITADEAINLLKSGESVHTFRNPTGILLGADWERDNIIEALKKSEDIQIGGSQCRKMGHGIVFWDKNSYVFAEHDEEKLSIFEPLKEKKGE